jgi:general secretion pathway protein L
METLLLRLPPATPDTAPDPAQWILLDSHDVPIRDTASGPLEEAAGLAAQRRVIALAPAEQVTLFEVRLKARNRQQLLRAVPYALEDELAEDVETLHFALGPSLGDDRYPVAVVARTHMQQWTTRLREAGLRPRALVPEMLALPREEGGWTLLQEPGRCVVRTAPWEGFYADPDLLSTLLELAWERSEDKPATLRCHCCSDAPPPNPPGEASLQRATTCPMALYAAGLDLQHPLDLLQGEFRPRAGTAKWARPWLAAGVLLAVWVAVEMGAAWYDLRQYRGQLAALRAQVEAVYKETFPGTRRVVNARVQMEQKLKELRRAAGSQGAGGLLPLLAAGAEAVSREKAVRVEGVTYRQGMVELRIAGKDLQSLERIKQYVEGKGLVAEIQSADTSGQKVSARIVIRADRKKS